MHSRFFSWRAVAIIGVSPLAEILMKNRVYTFSEADRKNPFDCKEYACSSKLDMFRKAMKSSSTKLEDNPVLVGVLEVKETDSKTNVLECPPDREELGTATWKLIHSIAANFPDDPTDRDKLEASQFIKSLAYLYPCHICAADFREAVSKSPPKYASYL